MGDLIDRRAAVDAIKGLLDSMLETDTIGFYEIENVLFEVPPAQSKRNKGKWIRRKNEDCWECSECHAVLENSDIENHNFYYCYHCGADMRGEQDE